MKIKFSSLLLNEAIAKKSMHRDFICYPHELSKLLEHFTLIYFHVKLLISLTVLM